MAECEAVAAAFDNTCTDGNALTDLAGHAGETVSCTGTMRCPNASGSLTYTSDAPCEWTRKLCVTCSEVSGVVRIKVQDNGMPNHCINSVVNNAIPFENEWEVNFNPDMTNIENYTASDFATSA